MRIVADQREKASGVPALLRSMGLRVEHRVLEEGDYIVFPECAVERKEVRDFMSSLFAGRLFDQASRLSTSYKIPVLILEGDVHTQIQGLSRPRIVWGALTTLTLQYGFHLFFTNGVKETANLLYTLSKQQGLVKARGPFVHKKFKKDVSRKTQILILSTLPGVGPKLAERLLKRFGSLRRVFSASVAELTLVEGLGRVKAGRIAEILDLPHGPTEKLLEQSSLTGDSEN